MVEYLTDLGGYCEVSTNGGYNTADWWRKLGAIAAKHPGLVHVHFCIDGHKETNHIYRVNTKWNIVERNISAFAETAPEHNATWVYIVFDHNEHELETAKTHATVLGFDFATRTGMRNSYHDWIAKLGKKDKKVEKKITTTGKKEHSKKDVIQDLDRFIAEYKSNKADENETTEVLKTVVCKYIHEGEIFIASDQTMWPCCFLWDSAFKNRENIINRLNHFDPGWNSLQENSIEDIQRHEWFTELLEASWEPTHPLHFTMR